MTQILLLVCISRVALSYSEFLSAAVLVVTCTISYFEFKIPENSFFCLRQRIAHVSYMQYELALKLFYINFVYFTHLFYFHTARYSVFSGLIIHNILYDVLLSIFHHFLSHSFSPSLTISVTCVNEHILFRSC